MAQPWLWHGHGYSTSMGYRGGPVPQHWLAPVSGLNSPIFPPSFLSKLLYLVNYIQSVKKDPYPPFFASKKPKYVKRKAR